MTRTRYAWAVVALLWVVAALNYVDRQVIFSVLPLLQADLNLSPAQLGLLSTVFLWVYGILSPFAGFLADRFGRVKVILVSLLVWSAVTWLTGHARNLGELLTARALMGISEACYIPAALGLVADYHGPRTRSLATGLHQSGLYAGLVLGGIGGGWMGEHYGWRFAFTILGAIGILYVLFLRFALRKPDAGPRSAADVPRFGSSLRSLAALPGYRTMATVFTLTSVANWVVYAWLAFYLYERFGMSLTLAGFSATFYVHASSFAGILIGGWLADTWSRRSSRGRLLTQTLGVAIGGPCLFLVGFTDSMAVLIAALVFYGVGRGLYDCNTMPVLCQIARPDLRSTGYGIFNFASCIAGGVATALAGILKDAIGLGVAFQAGAVIVLFSAFLLWLLRLPAEAGRV